MWEKGEERVTVTHLGLKKLWDCRSKGRETGLSEKGQGGLSKRAFKTSARETSISRVPEGCQILSSHFLRLREVSIQIEGVTYLSTAGDWHTK